MFALGLVSGKLFDLGYFHQVLGVGSVLYVFCMFMLSLADTSKYYQLILSQGVGMGIGSGLLLVPIMSVQAHHWRKRRSMAMGIVMTGSAFGGVIYPIMLNQLINSRTGFAWGVRATAFLTLGLLAIANCIMTTRLPNARQRPPGPKASLGSICTDVPYMLTLIGGFLVLWGLFFPYFYLQLWVNLHGISKTLGFYTIAILNASSFPGRTLPNVLADRVGQYNVIIPCAFITGCLIFVMFGATSPGAIIVFSILYGFFSGACISLFPPTVSVLARNVQEIGIRLGFAFFFVSFALLTGTPIVGALFDVNENWFRPIVFSAIVILSGTASLGAARYIVSQRKATQRL